MTQPDRCSNERACDSCPNPTSDLPEGGIQDNVQQMKIEAERTVDVLDSCTKPVIIVK